MTKTTIDMELISGLLQEPKTISSKYFYDAKGDELFQKIMELPEYYLTRAEFEILSEQSQAIVSATNFSKETHFEIVELGAGDGSKTKQLLSFLLKEKYKFTYKPIDISPNVLDDLAKNMEGLNGLKIDGIAGDYFDIFESLKLSKTPKLVLFLGSNLGNYEDESAVEFLGKIASAMNPKDALLLGLDLKKDPSRILNAYNDSSGVTRAFNLNLLTRMNRELGANFDLDTFEHYPEYDVEGKAVSYLTSLKNQTVFVAETGQSIEFSEGEKIRTEVSRKYDNQILEDLLQNRLQIKTRFIDSKGDFADYLLTQ